MANETILIVDADTKSQKVLEVSFKKAGYRVVMTDGPARARELVQDVSPDIIISDTQFPAGGTGFEFLADVKQGETKTVPFIFLTEERALPQKMKGFELGADDYLTKPIYIKEVTTRVELLLQKRAKEQLSEEDVEEIEGNVADITMIDLLQTIEEELRSGTIHLSRENQSAVIYFREGNILDAICGKLQGEEAIYRLMLWPDGEFVLRYHDQVRRVDRIEKDSGALLLEGIRRLDKYNELVDALPSLARVFEADYQKLARVIDQLPREVARVMRLFDGLRSIQEVTDGSPLDDVTTLKVVTKLIEDGYLVDVTPSKTTRTEARSRSNLATWLEGARSADEDRDEMGREDTSPKFGSSITDMVEKRPERTTERTVDAVGRKTLEGMTNKTRDTDPFGSRSGEGDEEREIRRTMPLVDAIESIDDLPLEDPDDEHYERNDPRRQTALQWDKGRDGWNIHFDSPEDERAAIREIEEEERQRRELEAQHLETVTRKSTLQFAPSVDRDSGSKDADVERELQDEERRRREAEAQRLQEQQRSMEPVEQPRPESRQRRRTDELPNQPLEPSIPSMKEEPLERVDTDEIFPAEVTPGPSRERKPTPLSSPAYSGLTETSSEVGEADQPRENGEPGVDSAWDEIAAAAQPREVTEVSEADVFEDDSDELARQPEEEFNERQTVDIRPPPDLTPLGAETNEPEVTPEMDPSGLFDSLEGETAPQDDAQDDDLDEISIDAIEALPTVERQAKDRELVRAEYDLSQRTTVAPWEISSRPEAVAERETAEIAAPDDRGSSPAVEHKFFEEEKNDQYDYFEDLGGGGKKRVGIWPILALAAAIILVVAVAIMGGEDEERSEGLADNTRVEPEDPVIDEPTVDEPAVAEPVETDPGLDEVAATAHASMLAESTGMRANDLTLVLSGADLFGAPDVGIDESDVGTTEPPVVAGLEPPTSDVVSDPRPDPALQQNTATPDPVVADEPPREKVTKATAQKIREAERLVQRERYADALALLRDLSEADPHNGEIAALHGRAAFNSNRTGEAVEHLGRAERLGHRTADLYLDLAAAYMLDGKKDRAKWAYEKFLKLQPDGRVADEVRTILSTQF